MKRWSIAFLMVLLACLPIYLHRSTAPTLLQDTDSAVLLEAIRERADPLSWFAGDWPLQNHFYRPVSTLAFELDNALHANHAAGYGATNAFLCIACVLALFWFLREVSDSAFVAGFGGVLFALWHFRGYVELSEVAWHAAWFTLAFGVFVHRRNYKAYLPPFLVLVYLSQELLGVAPLYGGVVAWLPGRTASVMTLFALVSMAAYARYERIGADRSEPPEPGPFDPPATKSTVSDRVKAPHAWVWAFVAVLGLWLALGSYEQAVMLPAALLGTALTLRFQRYRSRFGWEAVFWASLAGYLYLRHVLLPNEVSGYQEQQLRSGYAGIWLSLTEYVLPVLGSVFTLVATASLGIAVLVTPVPWSFLFQFAQQATTVFQARRRWVLALAGWLLSILAFLPMAWLQEFEHYHYWPMALRSLLVAALVLVAKDLVVIAWSRPTVQAPPRPTPAPGSLPRR